MKAMWCSDGGVSAVMVRRDTDGADVAQGSDGAWRAVRQGTIHASEMEARRAWLAAEVSKADRRLIHIDNELEELNPELQRLRGEVNALTREREQVIKGRAAVARLLSETYATEGQE